MKRNHGRFGFTESSTTFKKNGVMKANENMHNMNYGLKTGNAEQRLKDGFEAQIADLPQEEEEKE